MSKEIDDYLYNRYKINQIQGVHSEEKKKISIELLGLSYDWIKENPGSKNKNDLEDYLWTKCQIDNKKLGLSYLYYWIILKFLIKWIVEIVFERLENEKT